MGRTRSLKPGFFTNDVLCELPPLTRLLFAGLWILADREGRLLDRPSRIKVEVMGYDKLNVESALGELERHGFIRRYETAGLRCIQVTNWAKHQNPHPKEAPSELPPPPGTPIHEPGTAEASQPEPVRAAPDPGRAMPVSSSSGPSSSGSNPSGPLSSGGLPSGSRNAADAATATTDAPAPGGSIAVFPPPDPNVTPVPHEFTKARMLLAEGGLSLSGEECASLIARYPDRDHRALASYLVAWAADHEALPIRHTQVELAWRDRWGDDRPPPEARQAVPRVRSRGPQFEFDAEEAALLRAMGRHNP